MISALNHVNIATARLEESKRFFTEVLGLSVGYRPDFDFPGYWLYVGDRAIVHLVGVEHARRPSTEAVLDHVAFDLAEPEAMLERLRAAGVAYRELVTPDGRIRQIFLQDPNGVRLEFNTPTAAV
jgi:catechol 2,3-dioxygenase-like lactoylglutathione lyase family enzyme